MKLDKPFEAVAHGALALGQLVKVCDYLQHGYTIRLWEPHARTYSYFTLFDQGMRYPCQRSEPNGAASRNRGANGSSSN